MCMYRSAAPRVSIVIALLAIALTTRVEGQIRRADNNQVIPGTAGKVPGPGQDYSGLDLSFANLVGTDLSQANFSSDNLTSGVLTTNNFTQADFQGSTFIFADFSGSTLTNADFTNAIVRRANFDGATGHGFTVGQITSTQSYSKQNLIGIGLANDDLADLDLTIQNLTGADLTGSNLSEATLTNAILKNAVIQQTNFDGVTGLTKNQLSATSSYANRNLFSIGLANDNLTGFDFGGQNLTAADFGGSVLMNARFDNATLNSANFANATITGASFINPIGFTFSKLASTASYQNKNLAGIQVYGADFSGKDFSGQNLTGALIGTNLANANLQNSNLTNCGLIANVSGANFSAAIINGATPGSSGFTFAQLASTASYQQNNLSGINLASESVAGWNFSGLNLVGAHFGVSTNANFTGADMEKAAFTGDVTGANFTGSNVEQASFSGTNLTFDQLTSTASYQQNDLVGISLDGKFKGWDFSGLDLTGASLSGNLVNANLQNADLTNCHLEANVNQADIDGATITGATLSAKNLTFAQLASTASYRENNLAGVNFINYSVAGLNLSGQNLVGTTFGSLNNANFSGAEVKRANFDDTSLTFSQLASTASYKEHNLSGINLSGCNLAGADFSNQNLRNSKFITLGFYAQVLATAYIPSGSSILTNCDLQGTNLSNADFTNADLASANFQGSTLMNANFSDSDLRGASGWSSATVQTHNTINPHGKLRGLNLGPSEGIIIHNNPTPIVVTGNAALNRTSVIQFQLEGNWTSPISFAPGITPDLNDADLNLVFDPSVSPASLVGETFQLFNWNAPLPTGDQFGLIYTYVSEPLHKPAQPDFDFSHFYTDGTVTLLSVPPSSSETPALASPTSVPEPGAIAVLGGFAAFAIARRRR